MIRIPLVAVSLWALCAIAQTPPETLDPNMSVRGAEDGRAWYDARALGIEGQGWNEADLAHPYDRLPAKAEGVVRPPVWSLSRHSAGMSVRFVSDSPSIAARWTLRNENLAMDHMAATGVSGLDLYARDANEEWRYVGTGRPKEKTNDATLVTQAPAGFQEYWMFLPLYNGIESLEIGIDPDASIAKGPARDGARQRPIVFYGTSITQGGCASRAGMAYTNILARSLDWPIINLGFSGNGKMEPEIAALLAELDPVLFFIDSGGNMEPEEIDERCVPLIETIRAARPDTPIVMAELITLQDGWFTAPRLERSTAKNAAFRRAYERLVSKGVQRLTYIEGSGLLGSDSLATVDGTHPTDLGFLRMAEVFEPVLRTVLPKE